MTITLDLPPKLIDELSNEAARHGLSLPEYALRVLAHGRSSGPALKTGAELVAYWQAEGLIGTRKEVSDSQAYARELRREAERRDLS